MGSGQLGALLEIQIYLNFFIKIIYCDFHLIFLFFTCYNCLLSQMDLTSKADVALISWNQIWLHPLFWGGWNFTMKMLGWYLRGQVCKIAELTTKNTQISKIRGCIYNYKVTELYWWDCIFEGRVNHKTFFITQGSRVWHQTVWGQRPGGGAHRPAAQAGTGGVVPRGGERRTDRGRHQGNRHGCVPW